MMVQVQSVISSSNAAFDDEGMVIFETIYPSILQKEKVIISFEGITTCSTQFLNACIGKLYLLKEPDLIDKLIDYRYGSLETILKIKISEVKENAIKSKSELIALQ